MRKYLVASVLLMGVALAWTVVAWLSWPVWDDGWLELTQEGGPAQIAASMRDRPAVGALWRMLAEAGTLRTVSALAHALAWSGVGGITMFVWTRLFPTWSKVAIVPALVALSPVFASTQIVLVNPVWTSMLSVVLCWVPLLWLWPRSDRTRRTPVLGLVPGVASIFAGCVLSEYGVAAALSAGATLVVWEMRRDDHGRRGRSLSGWVLVLAALASFAMFRALIVDPGARPNVGPGALVAHAGARALSFPFFLLASLFQAEVGAIALRMGQIRIAQEGLERLSIVAAGAALVAAALTARALRDGVSHDAHGEAPSLEARAWPHLSLVAGATVGLAPFCLMARIPAEGSASRFWLPVLPVVAPLGLSLVVAIRSTLARRVLMGALIGTAVFASVMEGGKAIRERSAARMLARRLAPYVASGPTLIVLPESEAWPPYSRDYELTARLRLDMPSSVSRKFWVTREVPDPSTGLTLHPGAGLERPRLQVGWLRSGQAQQAALDRIVWASVGSDHQLHAVFTDYSTDDAPRRGGDDRNPR